jgi:hypothetical protein
MLLDRYNYKADDSYLQYEFNSEGPNGIIKKKIIYQYMATVNYIEHYNLGFGDIDNQTGEISDFRISNNNDRKKILSTVALTAIEFSDHFPGSKIYVTGSTVPRTRLFQMAIAAHFEEINKYFRLKGMHAEKGCIFFLPGHNYRAFLAARKKYSHLNRQKKEELWN